MDEQQDEHLEVERKFEFPVSAASAAGHDGTAAAGPDVVSALVAAARVRRAGVTRAGEPVRLELRATYYDTADLRLADARITLRRRTGGADAGWHLKLPAGVDSRREVRSPLGRRRSAGAAPEEAPQPPASLLALLRGLLRGSAVAPVATIHTVRTAWTLLGATGPAAGGQDGVGDHAGPDADEVVLAEVADDQVVGTALPTGQEPDPYVQTWRELEVELVAGGADLLAAATKTLRRAGVLPSASSSKLARVLERGTPGVAAPGAVPTDRRPRPAAATGTRTASGSRSTPASALVLGYLQEQVRALESADIAIRMGGPEGVHQFRVTCRRIRSALREHRAVLRQQVTDPLRVELAWVAAELSGARDSEVVLDHLRAVVAELAPELVVGPVGERLQAERDRADANLVRHTHSSLSSARYLQLRANLDALLRDPPLTTKAVKPARPVAKAALVDSVRRVRRRVRAAAGTTGAAHDAALHEVRKAAKTLRYTAEVAGTVRGGRTTELREAMKSVQELLGDRQDTVASRRECQRLGARADTAGDSSFTYGLLYAHEQARGEQAEEAFWALWDRLEL